MAEREGQRTKEAEAQTLDRYEVTHRVMAQARQRALDGRVVIKSKDQPWFQNRQARTKYYLHLTIEDTALQGWRMFVVDVRTHTGKHRHQGGLCIYVIEGKGWTVVDGVRHDWEAGDLLLLPVKPEGCEHQHFNAEPGSSAKWLAMIYWNFFEATGNIMEQKEISPDWGKRD